MSERLQKLLANKGLGSRREIEGWIRDGRITVNGSTATLGDQASEDDRITIDGKPVRIAASGPVRLLAYHKPVGEVTTRKDPEGRPTVFDSLPRLHGSKWISIGRLDINTSGLLLFTTDGQLANALMHPSHQIEREYAVRLRGEVTPSMIKAMTEGVMLEDGKARFEEIVEGGTSDNNLWFYVVIVEGRKREVRRLWESQGVIVSRLVRTRYGNVILKRSLPRGRFRDLDDDEGRELYALAGIKSPEKTRRKNSQRARKVKSSGYAKARR